MYQFDSVFGSHDDNGKVYDTAVRRLVDSSLRGYDCTHFLRIPRLGSVFCYGQTGSGKTHTMYGNKSDAGVVQRMLDDLYGSILQQQTTHAQKFKVTLSFLEIYNETINDLLMPSRRGLKLVDSQREGAVVKDLSEYVCESGADALTMLRLGEKNRHIGITQVNEKSSRSHTMYFFFILEKQKTRMRILVETKEQGKAEGESSGCSSTVNLVDLAGSECANANMAATTNREGKMETGCINKARFTWSNPDRACWC